MFVMTDSTSANVRRSVDQPLPERDEFGPLPRGTIVRVRYLGELDRNSLKSKEIVEQAEVVIREGIRALRQESSPN